MIYKKSKKYERINFLNSKNQPLEAARIKALDFAKANHMPKLKATNMKNYNRDDEKTFQKRPRLCLLNFSKLDLFFVPYFLCLFCSFSFITKTVFDKIVKQFSYF